jgi:hypothetical protein
LLTPAFVLAIGREKIIVSVFPEQNIKQAPVCLLVQQYRRDFHVIGLLKIDNSLHLIG